MQLLAEVATVLNRRSREINFFFLCLVTLRLVQDLVLSMRLRGIVLATERAARGITLPFATMIIFETVARGRNAAVLRPRREISPLFYLRYFIGECRARLF